jgi:hypothetical protein
MTLNKIIILRSPAHHFFCAKNSFLHCFPGILYCHKAPAVALENKCKYLFTNRLQDDFFLKAPAGSGRKVINRNKN